MEKDKLKAFLEGMYYVYARREIVNPDPLFFLYNYDDVRDREITGLVASSLAYGRVAQIMKSTEKVLSRLGKHPHEFLLNNDNPDILPEDFKHRFTTARDMNNLLRNMTEVLREYDSIEAFAGDCLRKSDGDIFSGMDKFAERLSRNKAAGSFSLISAPKDGSACKRLFLYLRWMVRKEDVDPGGWEVLKPSELIVPTDVHMHRIALRLGLTLRKIGDIVSAKQITSSFRLFCPSDPVKFDFPLTRLGIRAISSSFSG